MKNWKYNGFTLIELLVVISIIGLLASIALVSLQTARVKARDARRLTDIEQISKALQLYYDANGYYPASGGAISPSAGFSNSNDGGWSSLAVLLQPYISLLPIDPKQDSAGWPPNGIHSYVYLSDDRCGQTKQWYMLVYRLETANSPDPGVYDCTGALYQYGGPGATTFVKTVGISGRP